VQTLCGRRFCHPVTLFYKKSYTAFLKDVLAAAHNGAVTYTAAISDGERLIARTVREPRHYAYTAVSHDSKRYRFVALNEIGRLLVG